MDKKICKSILLNQNRKEFNSKEKILKLRKEIFENTGVYLKVYSKDKIAEYNKKLVLKTVFYLC